jgi:hypothetical protein
MAYYASREAAVIHGSTAEYARVTQVSPEFFRVFAIEPTVGRFFTPEEMKPGSGGALMISSAYWQSHFGGDPRALGQTVRIFGPRPIVGVLPPGFRFPNETDGCIERGNQTEELARHHRDAKRECEYPSRYDPLSARSKRRANRNFTGTRRRLAEHQRRCICAGDHLWVPAIRDATPAPRSGQNYLAVARLKPGVSLEQAQAEMTTIARRLEQQYPESNKGRSVAVTRMRNEMVGDVRLTLYLMLGAVGVVLLR